MVKTDNPICLACGVEYDRETYDAQRCDICLDERQYVRWDGQAWTTLDILGREHSNRVESEGPGLVGIWTQPQVAIGQRALLVQGREANVLWDCISYLDEATVDAIRQRGGVDAIAVSHPHFYGSMMTWSQAFGDVPVFVHADDERWVPDHAGRDNVVFWEGVTREIADGLTLVNAGVHFDGGTVLHWSDGADGAGALLSGDIFQVVMDRAHVGFMYSYPNLIPEKPDVILTALDRVRDLPFAAVYGGWWRRNITVDAMTAIERSADRYLRRVGAVED